MNAAIAEGDRPGRLPHLLPLKQDGRRVDRQSMGQLLLIALLILGAIALASRLTQDESVSMPGEGLRSGAAGTVESLMLAGRKIDAIKLLREETGMGLKDAKEEVESRMRRFEPR